MSISSRSNCREGPSFFCESGLDAAILSGQKYDFLPQKTRTSCAYYKIKLSGIISIYPNAKCYFKNIKSGIQASASLQAWRYKRDGETTMLNAYCNLLKCSIVPTGLSYLCAMTISLDV